MSPTQASIVSWLVAICRNCPVNLFANLRSCSLPQHPILQVFTTPNEKLCINFLSIVILDSSWINLKKMIRWSFCSRLESGKVSVSLLDYPRPRVTLLASRETVWTENTSITGSITTSFPYFLHCQKLPARYLRYRGSRDPLTNL